MPTVQGAVGPPLPVDMAVVTVTDSGGQAGVVLVRLMAGVTKSDTVFVTPLALTSDAVVVLWLVMTSGMSTGKKLRLRTIMAFATKPDMTPMNLLITITVTTLDKTAATTTRPYLWMWSATTAALRNGN